MIKLYDNDICPNCNSNHGDDEEPYCSCGGDSSGDVDLKNAIVYYNEVTNLFSSAIGDAQNQEELKSIVKDCVDVWYIKNINLIDVALNMSCFETEDEQKEIEIFDIYVPFEYFIDAICDKLEIDNTTFEPKNGYIYKE